MVVRYAGGEWSDGEEETSAVIQDRCLMDPYDVFRRISSAAYRGGVQ